MCAPSVRVSCFVSPRGNDSGDATLAVFDLRQKKLEGRVTNQEDELLSIQVVKVRPKLEPHQPLG